MRRQRLRHSIDRPLTPARSSATLTPRGTAGAVSEKGIQRLPRPTPAGRYAEITAESETLLTACAWHAIFAL
jgi:hypothetical protein